MDSRTRDQGRRPADDGASVSSYSSDAYTLEVPVEEAGFDDDLRSIASYDSYDTCRMDDDLPSYRVSKEQGVSQPVYEAWILYLDNTSDRVEKTNLCGLNLFTKRHPLPRPYVVRNTRPYDQHELSEMTLTAMQRYHASSKRCLPSRLFRGRPETYERDLDNRIRKLPRAVQFELDALLGDRENATRNRFHRRDWTVTMLREQYSYRFASAEYEEVQRSKCFWKNGSNKGRFTEFFFIIRGAEGKVATNDRGMYQATVHGNPWKRVDEAELVQKQRARDIRRFGKQFVLEQEQEEWRYHRERRGRSSSPYLPPSRRVRIERDEPDAFPAVNPFDPLNGSGSDAGLPSPRFHPPSPSPPPAAPYTGEHNRFPPLLGGQPMPYIYPHAWPYSHMGMYYPPPPPPPPPPPADIPVPGGDPGLLFHDLHCGFNYTNPPFTGLPLSSSSTVPIPPHADYHLSTNDMAPPHEDPLRFDPCLWRPASTPYCLPNWSGSPCPSPPPAPRLSNLTTPTTFSPATSNRTGSSVEDGLEVRTPVEMEGLEVRDAETESAPGSRPVSILRLWRPGRGAHEHHPLDPMDFLP